MKLCFADVETTGTNPARHVVWDIAIIVRDDGHDHEHQWFIKPDLPSADPAALRIGRYYERTAELLPPLSRKMGSHWADPDKAAAEIARLLDGATLVAHNPAFDVAFIGAFLRRHGHTLTADYHLRDIGSLVTGYLAGRAAGFCVGWSELAREVRRWPECREKDREPRIFEDGSRRGAAPPESLKLAAAAEAVGLKSDAYEAHTALGDAQLARDIWDAVMGS